MTCVFCGTTQAMVPIVFPFTFTAFQFLQAGDRACVRCAEMFQDPRFRRNCWILKDGKFVILDNPLQALSALPDPPFLIYFTKQKRKHGWILAVQNLVLNRDRFVLVVDEEKVLFERVRFYGFVAFCRELLNRGVPKGVLLGGIPWPSVIRKYGLAWPECWRLRDLQKDQLWRFVVEFAKRS